VSISGSAPPRDTLADASGSIAHSAGVYCAANGQQLSKQLGDFRKRRKRGELGGHIGEFGRHASFKRQRRKAARFLRDVTTLATDKPPHPKRHMAEQRPKGHLPVSLARKHRPGIRAATKSLPIVDACARTISVWIAAVSCFPSTNVRPSVSETAQSSLSIRATSISVAGPAPKSATSLTRHTSFCTAPPPQ